MGLTFGDSEEKIRKSSTDTLKAALLTTDGIGEKKKAVALEALMGKTIECKMKTINLNYEVRAKLTDHGRKILRKYVEDNLSSHPFGEDFYNTHKEYVTLPLWELMEIFGHAMFIGNPSLPFENTNLEIVRD